MLRTLMGHKKIETTLIYTRLRGFGEEEYICKTATTIEESRKLIEQGLEFVHEFNGIMIFRKRK